MIAYLFVSQGIANLHSWYGAAERRLSERVGSGDIVTDLLRPLDFQWACFAEVTGQGLVQGGLVLGVLVVTSLWIGEIRALADLVYLPIFVLSVVLGFVIMYSISFLAGLASFWTINYWGLFYAKKVVVDLLSGG
jgi:ABC-2 type transport system permease protein